MARHTITFDSPQHYWLQTACDGYSSDSLSSIMPPTTTEVFIDIRQAQRSGTLPSSLAAHGSGLVHGCNQSLRGKPMQHRSQLKAYRTPLRLVFLCSGIYECIFQHWGDLLTPADMGGKISHQSANFV
jgi:hypothetical protein